MKFAKGLQEIQIVLIKYNNMVYILKVSKSSSVFLTLFCYICVWTPHFQGIVTLMGALLSGSKKCFIQSVTHKAGRISGRVLLFFRGGATKDWEQLKIILILSRSSTTKKVPHA